MHYVLEVTMNEFSISSLILIARKCIWHLIASVLICAVVSYCYCSFIATPTYQSKVSFVASNGGMGANANETDKIISSDVAASLAMINTYVDVLKTSGAYRQLSTALGGKYTATQLKKMISVQSRHEDSLFIDVTVTSTSPNESVRIANAFLNLGENYVSTAMNEPDKKLILKAEDSSSAVQNYPTTAITVVIAAVLGFVVVYAIALIINVMDKTIKGEGDFAATYDIPILGNIPNFKAAAKGEKKYEK